jgi:HSP20 family protein
MRPEFDNAFGREFLANKLSKNSASACECEPETNIRRMNDEFRIDMAAPGRNKDDFKIKLEDNVLTISYEKIETNSSDFTQEKFLRREFGSENFTRQFTLPEITDNEKISAKYENGILMVRIPYEDPAKNKISRTININ